MPFDGDTEFSGGCDSYTEPHVLPPGHVSRLVNGRISRTGDRIKPRWGYRFIPTLGNSRQSEILRYGKFQGEGLQKTLDKGVVLYGVFDGWIFEATRSGKYSRQIRVINSEHQINPGLDRVWLTRTPDGVVVTDGESKTLLVNKYSEVRALDEADGELPPGKFGAYIQNRFWFADITGTTVLGSDLHFPTKITEIQDGLPAGFIPGDDSEITAIGKQKHLLRDIHGGSLLFSTRRNLYTVAPLGDRANWGSDQTTSVSLALSGSGASSHDSMAPFNNNIWFRSQEYGIANFMASQAQFLNNGDLYSQSAEADVWLKNDSPQFLDRCYTEGYENRLFTTVSPMRGDAGDIYWGGLVVMQPNAIVRSAQRGGGTRRYEGLWTGIRPLGLTVTTEVANVGETYIWSKDRDGINRLYVMDKQLDHDITFEAKRQEIMWDVETRDYAFENALIPKRPKGRFLSLHDIERVPSIKVKSRTENSGEWQEFYNESFQAGRCDCGEEHATCDEKNNGSIFGVSSPRPQERPLVPLPAERGNAQFFTRAYRIEVTGKLSLGRVLAEAELESISKQVYKEPENCTQIGWSDVDDFRYSVT